LAVTKEKKPNDITSDEWERLDKKAQGTIWLCLVDYVLLNVASEKSTHSLWKHLGEIYQAKSMVNKLYLKSKLFSMKMKEGESIIEHLNSFNLLLSQLASVDVEVNEEDKCILLLCSLPESWENVILSITTNLTNLKLDTLVLVFAIPTLDFVLLSRSLRIALRLFFRPLLISFWSSSHRPSLDTESIP